MKTTKQIRGQRAVVKENMRKLVEGAKDDENRDLNADELTSFDSWNAEMKDLELELQRALDYDAIQATEAKELEKVPEKKVDPQKAYELAFWKYAEKGDRGLDLAEQNILSEYKGTGNQTTTTTQGGFTIPQGFSNELEVEAAKWGGLLTNCRVIKTETGNNIKWPYVDDTGVTAVLLSEGTADTVSDMTFSSKDLDAYTYSSNTVKISRQLMQDSYFNLPEWMREALGRRIGTGLNAAFTTADGSSKPQGIMPVASIGATSAANTTPTRGEITELIHSVDPAYRTNGKLAFNDNTLSLIKQLSFGSGDARPLWSLSMRDGEPDKIEGYSYFINQDMASFGAGNLPMAFGDWSKFVIRYAGDIEFLRLNERFADALLVGFMAFIRADSELIAGNAIKTMRNPTT